MIATGGEIFLAWVVIIVVLVVIALLQGQQRRDNWATTAEALGLILRHTQISGEYHGRKVSVENVNDPEADHIPVALELQKCKSLAFSIYLRSRLPAEMAAKYQPLGQKYTILKSSPPDLVERVFATPVLLERLNHDNPSPMGIILQDSTLNFDYPDIRTGDLAGCMELMREVADAVERTPAEGV